MGTPEHTRYEALVVRKEKAFIKDEATWGKRLVRDDALEAQEHLWHKARGTLEHAGCEAREAREA